MNARNFRAAVRTDALFEPVGERAEPIGHRSREEVRTAYRVYRASDGYEVSLRAALIERMLSHARCAAPNETYGLLVGHVNEDPLGQHTVVEGVVIDTDAAVDRAHVQTSHESELRTRELCRGLYPDCVILGWFHTHPRYGLVFSGTDRHTQSTWRRTYSLGIVADPWDPGEIGAYRGPECERLQVVAPRVASSVRANTAEAVEVRSFDVRPRSRPMGRGAGVLAIATLALAAITTCRQVADLSSRVEHLESRESSVSVTVVDPARDDLHAVHVPSSADVDRNGPLPRDASIAVDGTTNSDAIGARDDDGSITTSDAERADHDAIERSVRNAMPRTRMRDAGDTGPT